jgi:hypothetical protein
MNAMKQIHAAKAIALAQEHGQLRIEKRETGGRLMEVLRLVNLQRGAKDLSVRISDAKATPGYRSAVNE